MTTEELAAASSCYVCMSREQMSSAVLYLLNQIVGTGLTTAQLADASKCYCIPDKLAADIYLLDQILP